MSTLEERDIKAESSSSERGASYTDFHKKIDESKRLNDPSGFELVCGLLTIRERKKNQWMDGFQTGTAFRVGENHVMTACHCFKPCIERICEKIAGVIHLNNIPRDTLLHESLDLTKKNCQEMTQAIYEFLLIPRAMDIEQFIDKFRSYSEGYKEMQSILRDQWFNQAVKVKFGSYTVGLSPNIPFVDREQDVIVLQMEGAEKLPVSFRIWVEPKQVELDTVDVVGYAAKDEEENNTQQLYADRDCNVYNSRDDTRLTEDIDAAKKYWQQQATGEPKWLATLRINRESWKPLKGAFVLHTSYAFIHGTSGSPIIKVITVGGMKRIVVYGMYTRGTPGFYYGDVSKLSEGSQPEFIKNAKDLEDMRKNNDGNFPYQYFFEYGISMSQIASLLDDNNVDRSIVFPSTADEETTKLLAESADKYEKYFKTKHQDDQ